MNEPTNLRQSIKTKKSKGKTLPKQFHWLANWEQIMEEESDEDEQNRRKSQTAIPATGAWEKPKEESGGGMIREKVQAVIDHYAIETHQHVTATP